MLLAFMTLFPACTTSQALVPSGLVGRWAGSGTFFNRDLHAKVGPLPFVTEFTTEGAGTGRIGQVVLQDVRVVRPTQDYVEVRAKLSGAGLSPRRWYEPTTRLLYRISGAIDRPSHSDAALDVRL